MRIGVLAGEASGDILGSSLLSALSESSPGLVVEGIGGPLMEAQGMRSMFPMERLSVMGFVEPFKRLPELLRIQSRMYRHFLDDPPDVFVGIDLPDFNLRLEQKLRRQNIPTAHLVSPSVWAWRQGRIKRIKQSVDLMLCLFPFETAIYEQHGVAVQFVGHPLADQIPLSVDREAARVALGIETDGPVLAVLPGSRGSEVRLLAPLFFQTAEKLRRDYPALRIVVPAANANRLLELRQILEGFSALPVQLVEGHSREVMAAADAVLLASGTATLEAALLKRPMVVAYRMSSLSWSLVSRLLKTEFGALPNVLTGAALVPELIQDAARPEAMAAALRPLLDGSDSARRQVAGFEAIHHSLRQGASQRAAAALLALAEA